MKIIFMGTPDFSVPTLKTLIGSEHELIAVVTQQDKPKGRGNKLSHTPVKEVALEYNIPVFQPKKVREAEFIQLLTELQPDVIVVIAFGQILPKALLEIPKFGCINVHASLLPKYRGAGPIQWSVMNGEKETGLTTMFMDIGLDTGDMLLKEAIEIDKDETGGSLHDKLSILGGPLLIRTLKQLEEGSITRICQDHQAASYAPMLSKELGKINWNNSAIEIERLIRGLNPWPSAYTYYEDKMLKIWKAELVTVNDNTIKAGTIIDIVKNEGFIIKCNENALFIKELQLQGKNKMDAASFLRGVTLNVGYNFN
ncbi:MAG: methionyl-tRNA formyltransferase [Firmicutes bacterium HGW-Firmicutes-1]|jgi:methionyl-tRNA formyltransferase|nr:MAG: methionyl-tRNA formyltransferase [Firmicutes bacterium HGW-Firmicutes-1]